MIINSIRLRLQLWLAFLLVVILGGFGFTAYQLQRDSRMNQIDDELERRLAALNTDVRGSVFFGNPFIFDSPGGRMRPDGPGADKRTRPGKEPSDWPMFDFGPGGHWHEGPFPREPGKFSFDTRKIELSPATAGLFGGASTNDYYYATWGRGGAVMLKSTNASVELAVPTALKADSRIHTRMAGNRREAFQFTEIGECLLVGRYINTDLAAMRQFAWWLLIAGGGILALALGGGWWLASRAIRPVEEISAAASRISAGNLSERINTTETESELGRLAGVLNNTFARLETAFAQQKQFTADVSHELRTPIAVLISEAQTTLARERSAAEYRETVKACLDTAQQMRRLAQSLLELARFDAGQETITRETMDLADHARACVELIRPLANERGILIHADLAPASAIGDPVRLGQVITNLLTNAVHYNRDQGSIRVVTRDESNAVMLSVTDTGVGIAIEDLPHVFDRFYRGDKARSSANGQTGLGLAISKSIVDAHGGSIVVGSKPGEGTTFIVRLPK